MEKQFRTVIQVLVDEMHCECKEAVIDRLQELTPDTTAYCELPKLKASNSAPTGAKIIGAVPSSTAQ